MRNIHERERDKPGRGSHRARMVYIKEQEKEQELSQLSEQTKLSEQELSRLKNTTAQRVLLDRCNGIALLLFLIVMIVGANVFHW